MKESKKRICFLLKRFQLSQAWNFEQGQFMGLTQLVTISEQHTIDNKSLLEKLSISLI